MRLYLVSIISIIYRYQQKKKHQTLFFLLLKLNSLVYNQPWTKIQLLSVATKIISCSTRTLINNSYLDSKRQYFTSYMNPRVESNVSNKYFLMASPKNIHYLKLISTKNWLTSFDLRTSFFYLQYLHLILPCDPVETLEFRRDSMYLSNWVIIIALNI